MNRLKITVRDVLSKFSSDYCKRVQDGDLDARILAQELLTERITEAIVKAPANGDIDLENLGEFVLHGLATDGAHHKQWFLWEIARFMGLDPSLEEYEEGTPP